MGVLRDRRDRGLPFTLRAPRVEKNVTPLSRRLNFHRYGEWPGTGNGMVGEWWLVRRLQFSSSFFANNVYE